MQNTNSQKLHVCFSVESYYQNGKQQNILQFTRSVIGAIFKLVSLRQIFDQTWHGKYFPANEWMYNVAFHTLKEPGSFTVVRNREILGPRRRKSYELFYSSVAKKWRLLISIHLILSAKEMNPIIRKNMLKLVIQTSFIAVDQTHAEWQTFEKPENKRQMYDSQVWAGPDCNTYSYLIFESSNVCHSRVFGQQL